MMRNRQDRRSFLKRSAAVVAAGVASPWVTMHSYLRGESPNEKPGVGSIGVGGRGTDIGHQAGNLGKMVACADVHAENARRFAHHYQGKCEVFGDYRKVLDRRDVDLITCGTPDHWHVKVSLDALRAGKDLYCEKPLTLTMAEGQLITRVASETKRVFQVGTQQRSEFGSMFLKAIAIARSGRLGKKLHATSSVGGANGDATKWKTEDPPKALDWEFWLGQAAKEPFNAHRIGWDFRWWFEYSGGQVTDWGVHHTDIAVWALGGEETGIVQAEGKGEYTLGRETMRDVLLGKKPFESLPPCFNVAHTFDCKLLLPNGNSIDLVSKDNDLTIEGEKGKIVVNRDHLNGAPVDEINGSEKDKKWLEEEVAKLYRGMPIQGHMANFFHCAKTREKPISDVWTHINSVNACHMANIAMLVGRKVTFDPAKHEFKSDAEANALMSRKQRAPYTVA